MAFRMLARAAAGGAAVGAAALAADAERRDAIYRFGVASVALGRCVVDYQRTVAPVEKEKGKASAEAKAASHEFHLRTAAALRDLAIQLGGMYVKGSQYVSTLNHVLPREYTQTLAVLQDRAAARPWSQMRGVVEADFGVPAEQLFAHVDEQPLAAASIAEVFRAVTHSGEEVCVKVQYADLRRKAAADMASLLFFINCAAVIWPEWAFSWIWPELAASVSMELSFSQEAENGRRAAAHLAHLPAVHVPRVLPHLSSDRVLTQEFVRGVKPTDADAMAALGADPAEVRRTIITAFNEQIFVTGFCHTDPHPGNLLVFRDTRAPGAPVRVSILDHGMYRRSAPAFRVAYCHLWRALVTGDTELGRRAVRALGLHEDALDVLSLMLTMRPAGGGGTALGGRINKAQAAALKEKYGGWTPADFTAFMRSLPKDLLFVTRNQNIVRSLNLSLGGTARERFRLTAEAAVRGSVLTERAHIAERDDAEAAEAQSDGVPSSGAPSSGSSGGRRPTSAVVEAAVSSASAPLLARAVRLEGVLASPEAAQAYADKMERVFAVVARFLRREPAPAATQAAATAISNLQAASVMQAAHALNAPTEWELQDARERLEAARSSSWGPGAAWRTLRHFTRELRLAFEVRALYARLAAIDVGFWLVALLAPGMVEQADAKIAAAVDGAEGGGSGTRAGGGAGAGTGGTEHQHHTQRETG